VNQNRLVVGGDRGLSLVQTTCLCSAKCSPSYRMIPLPLTFGHTLRPGFSDDMVTACHYVWGDGATGLRARSLDMVPIGKVAALPRRETPSMMRPFYDYLALGISLIGEIASSFETQDTSF
jgi:hypothetical protein